MNNYDSNYHGLDNLTKTQIESLAYRTGVNVRIKQKSNYYYLILGRGIATSKIYKGNYIKNKNYPNIY